MIHMIKYLCKEDLIVNAIHHSHDLRHPFSELNVVAPSHGASGARRSQVPQDHQTALPLLAMGVGGFPPWSPVGWALPPVNFHPIFLLVNSSCGNWQ